MKKFFIIFNLILLNFKMTNAQQLEVRKWATFHEVKQMKFTASFMKEMSKQLKTELETQMNFTNFVDEIDFALNVGKIDTNLVFEKDSVKLKVELTNSFDKSWQVWCKWSSKNFSSTNDIHQKEINGKEVLFQWCSDLPIEDFKKIINSKMIIPEGLKKKLKFDLDIYMNIYPPDNCQFIFKKAPTKKELKQINDFFTEYQISHNFFLFMYLGNFLDDPRYMTTLAFQVNEWNKEKFPNTILDFFETFNNAISNENITKIIVRH